MRSRPMRMRFITSIFALCLLAVAARADSGPTVIADCKTAITASAFGGYSVRIVSGGFTPGMQAYIHGLPSTNAKSKDATFIGALNVKQGAKPANDTTQLIFVGDDPSATFSLDIKKAKTSGGQSTATLQKSQVGGKTLDVQDMVCM